MFNPDILSYKPGNDLLQTRSRHPRKIMPNFALYCDWIIWNLNSIHLDKKIIPRTIYVSSNIQTLNYFIDNVLKTISHSFILITTSHDTTMPAGFGKYFGLQYQKILDCKYLKYWFTENRDLKHEKIKPLTLGIPHPDLPSWLEKKNNDTIWNSSFLKKSRKWIAPNKRQKIFGCWFSRADHPSGTCPTGNDERQGAWDHFTGKPDIFDWYPPEFGRIDFIKKLGEYQFVLCPHGGGLDPNPKCWESLLMEAIPIVKRNTISEALMHLPIIIVDEWSEVTRQSLIFWKKEFCHQLDRVKLEHRMSNSFFFNRILQHLEGE